MIDIFKKRSPADGQALAQAVEVFDSLPENIVTLQELFEYPGVREFYKQSAEQNQRDEAVSLLGSLVPRKSLPQASLLAFLCGALVEEGAAPEPAFLPACAVLRALLEKLEPYCAQSPEEEEEKEGEDGMSERWEATQKRLSALTDDERADVETMRNAAQTIVLPLMAMLMRSVENYRLLVQNRALCERIDYCQYCDSLEIEGLHYLHSAARLTYDEVAVVLPTSRTGMLVDAHAINNTFHAFTLLQPLLAEHAKALKLGNVNRAVLETEEVESARYLWLSTLAYEHGELKNELAWAWGEAALYEMPRRDGRLVLIALEKEKHVSRNWSNFCNVLHDAQHSQMRFKRYLTAEEVARYLDESP